MVKTCPPEAVTGAELLAVDAGQRPGTVFRHGPTTVAREIPLGVTFGLGAGADARTAVARG